MNADARILLVDNGSLEPASTLQLRRLAADLAVRVGKEVVPASIAHSSRIPAERLDGRPAELFDAALDRVLAEGATEVCVVPVFIGPSYAIVRHLPAVIAQRCRCFPPVRIALAAPLFVATETRLAQLLSAHVRDLLAPAASPPEATNVIRSDHVRGFRGATATLPRWPAMGCCEGGRPKETTGIEASGADSQRKASVTAPSGEATKMIRSDHLRGFARGRGERRGSDGGVRVAVVDHGSPSRAVTEVRDAVAAQVRALLGNEVEAVAACSMERREGPGYAFNEPLLEHLLREDGWRDAPVIVALLFIAPGRHAGPLGDVAQIVQRARPDGGAGVRFTPVMGAHPLLVEVLADRVRDARRLPVAPAAVAGAIGAMRPLE